MSNILQGDLAAALLEEAALVEPFFRENGKIFMKFDRIDVERNQLVFYWRGQQTVTKPLEPGDRGPGDVVTISGIEAKTEITLESD